MKTEKMSGPDGDYLRITLTEGEAESLRNGEVDPLATIKGLVAVEGEGITHAVTVCADGRPARDPRGVWQW